MFTSKISTATSYVLHGTKVGGTLLRHGAPTRRQAVHQMRRCMSVWSRDFEPHGTISAPAVRYLPSSGNYHSNQYSSYMSHHRGFATLADVDAEEEENPQVVVEFHDDNDGTVTVVTVDSGTKITEAADQAGVFIPTVSSFSFLSDTRSDLFFVHEQHLHSRYAILLDVICHLALSSSKVTRCREMRSVCLWRRRWTDADATCLYHGLSSQ
jgi:hypothetical protein